MLGHGALEVAPVREEERLQAVPDGVEVGHQDHAHHGGDGDQQGDEEVAGALGVALLVEAVVGDVRNLFHVNAQ